AADTRYPGVKLCEFVAQGFDLSDRTAPVWIVCPQRVAKPLGLFSRRYPGRDGANLDSISILQLFAQPVGLRKEESGIEEKNVLPRIDLYRDVDKRNALRSKSGCDRQAVAELLDRPCQGVAGIGGAQFQANLVGFVFARQLLSCC